MRGGWGSRVVKEEWCEKWPNFTDKKREFENLSGHGVGWQYIRNRTKWYHVTEIAYVTVIPRNIEFGYRYSKIGTKREKLLGEGGVSFGWRHRQRKRGGARWSRPGKKERMGTKRGRAGAKKLLVSKLLWSRLVPDHQNVTHLIKLSS